MTPRLSHHNSRHQPQTERPWMRVLQSTVLQARAGRARSLWRNTIWRCRSCVIRSLIQVCCLVWKGWKEGRVWDWGWWWCSQVWWSIDAMNDGWITLKNNDQRESVLHCMAWNGVWGVARKVHDYRYDGNNMRTWWMKTWWEHKTQLRYAYTLRITHLCLLGEHRDEVSHHTTATATLPVLRSVRLYLALRAVILQEGPKHMVIGRVDILQSGDVTCFLCLTCGCSMADI